MLLYRLDRPFLLLLEAGQLGEGVRWYGEPTPRTGLPTRRSMWLVDRSHAPAGPVSHRCEEGAPGIEVDQAAGGRVVSGVPARSSFVLAVICPCPDPGPRADHSRPAGRGP